MEKLNKKLTHSEKQQILDSFDIPDEIDIKLNKPLLSLFKKKLKEQFLIPEIYPFDDIECWLALSDSAAWHLALVESLKEKKYISVLDFYNNIKYPELRMVLNQCICIKASEVGVITHITKNFCEKIFGGKLPAEFEKNFPKEKEKKKDFKYINFNKNKHKN